MSAYTQAIITEAAVTTIIVTLVGGLIALLAVRRITRSLTDHVGGVLARQHQWTRDEAAKLDERIDGFKAHAAELHEGTRDVIRVPFAGRDTYTGEAAYPASAGPADWDRRPATGRLDTPRVVPAPTATFPPLAGTGPEARHRDPDVPAYPPAPGADRVNRRPDRRARHGL